MYKRQHTDPHFTCRPQTCMLASVWKTFSNHCKGFTCNIVIGIYLMGGGYNSRSYIKIYDSMLFIPYLDGKPTKSVYYAFFLLGVSERDSVCVCVCMHKILNFLYKNTFYIYLYLIFYVWGKLWFYRLYIPFLLIIWYYIWSFTLYDCYSIDAVWFKPLSLII